MRTRPAPVRRITALFTVLTCVGWMMCACGSSQATNDAQAEPARVVAKIVFVGQEECCKCTRERIDGTWNELTAALGEGSELPVERIHGDSQAALAQPYLDLRPMMVAPGLYFLDADGGLIEMLQGELTQAQIAEVLR